MLIHYFIKRIKFILLIIIIIIINITDFLSVSGQSYCNNNIDLNSKISSLEREININHHIKKKEDIDYHVKQISIKNRRSNLFFLKKTKFIIMNNTLINLSAEVAEAEYLFKKKDYKKALLSFKKIINQFSFKKEFYNFFIKKIALCYFFLKKYDLAITFFKSILKDNTDNSAEENIFYLGMCYYLQSNDYFFFQKNRMKYIKIFLFLRKKYPNSRYLPKVEKIIYNAFLTLKKKKESIGMYYFNKKKYNSSRRVFKQIINDYKDIFNIQKEYIYMIISQYKVEKENKNSSFEETMILHNTYMQEFLETENQNHSHFIYEMNLSLPSKIKKQFQKIEIHLILIKQITQYLINNEFKKI